MSQQAPPPSSSSQPTPQPPQQPAPPFDYARERRRDDGRNVWAIVSLVCGLLGFVPFVTGALAILTGILGIRRGRSPFVGGRTLATVGLVLGVLSVGFWSLGGMDVLGFWKAAEAPRMLAGDFLRDLSAGDTDAARNKAGILVNPQHIAGWSEAMAEWGPLREVTTSRVSIEPGLGGTTACELFGTAEFATETRAFDMSLVEQDGKWRVTSLTFHGAD